MKRISLFISFSLLLFSCTVRKKPIFLRVDNVELISFAADTIKLKSKAFFKNNNDIGGKITTDGVEVLIDQKPIASVKSEEFKVPANKEFSIPLIISVPSNKIFDAGLLGGLLETLSKSKTIEIQFKGNIQYKVLGFSSNYQLDKTKELKLNQ